MIGSDGMKISTSILSAKDRIESIKKLNRTNTSYIHVDVMDGKFVQDKQFDTYEKVHSVSLVSEKKLDIHLMVDNPYEYVIQYKNMDIEFITIHVESSGDKKKTIDEIKGMGYKVGLAIKPNTDVKELEKYLDDIDMILVMSVEPGKGGQTFIHSSVEKIDSVKKLIGDRNILVEVDGGINDETISLVQDVDIAVVGSYIVGSDNYYKSVDSLVSFNVKVEDSENNKNYSVFFAKFFDNFVSVLFLIFLIFLIGVFLIGIYSAFFGINDCLFCSGDSHQIYGYTAFFGSLVLLLMSLLFSFITFFPWPLLGILLVTSVITVIMLIFNVDAKKIISKKLLAFVVISILLFILLFIVIKWCF